MADVEEINEKPVTIDVNGFLRLPLVGRLRAAGLSLTEFETELSDRYQTYLVRPDVSVSVSAFRSQPVSVVGAVKTPGIYQVEGRRTIFEMLSLAGGLDPAAGATLNITRRLEYGRIPLPSAEDNATGEFSVANVRLKSIMSATNPEENIAVMPHDVITVPRAEIVYVIGEVQKAGGFTLNEQEHMTILQALSLAGGLAREASSKNAKILRAASAQTKREELPVNVKAILDGKAPDVTMQPEDILFVPSSQPKRAAARAAEAAIQVATGVIIWRR
jgi:polysaccharide export outer membrane protein